jgi:hypothetical protein
MRERTLSMAMSYAPNLRDTRLPVWLCMALTLGGSATCYWLLFRLIGALWSW